MPYKRRRFTTKRAWADHGLRPFLEACRGALEGRYVDAEAAAWRALVGRRPRAGMPGRALKAIEDSWDAVLCALAAALDHLAPGVMRAYAPPGRAGWRRGYILGPVLPTAAAGPATPERAPGDRRRAAPEIRVDRPAARAYSRCHRSSPALEGEAG
jgi:predicted RNase H-like nuclease